MVATTPPLQRKRDRVKSLLSRRSRPVSPHPPVATTSSSQAPSQLQMNSTTSTSVRLNPADMALNSAVDPVPSKFASAMTAIPPIQQAPTVPASALVVLPTTNPAFNVAIQNHLDKLPEIERKALAQANRTITPDGLLAKIKLLDTEHALRSLFRPHAARVAKFLSLLDRLLGGTAIAIQTNPDISSIAVGGVKLVVDIAMQFAKFFDKLTDMLDRLSEIIAPLERYAQRFELLNVGNALVDVYGDILDFCRASSALFLDKDGRSKIHTTFEMFLHSQWEPFETEFGEIAGLKEREDTLRWLSPHDFQHKQDHTFKTRHKGTGDWFLQTNEFLQWETTNTSRLLWCHGKPGAGKSVLASHVINHIQEKFVGKQIGLCFAYFSFADPSFQDLTPLIALFSKQLCQQHGTIPEHLMRAKQETRDPASVSNANTFAKITGLYQGLFIVIDGLDECPEVRRSPILDFIAECLGNSKTIVKLFVSSREEYDINSQFEQLDTTAIEIETGKITPDIRKFVNTEASRLRTGFKLRISDDKLFAEVVQKIVEKSDGMFLWASLQLQQLCRASRADNDQWLKQALDYLPQGLVAIYTRIFDEIAEGPVHARKVALECFRWIKFAKKSPSLDNLKAAVALSQSSCTTEDLESRLLSNGYISEACRNLLLLPGPECSYNLISPIHFSLLEYLQDLPLDRLQGNFWRPLMDSHDAESVLACRCMDWLTLALPMEMNSSTSLSAYVRLAYPIHYFDRHAICATIGPSKCHPSLLASITRLLGIDARRLAFLVKSRLIPTQFGAQALGRNFDETLAKNYLFWISDLYLLPGLDVDWVQLEIPKYALHFAVWFRPEKVPHLLSTGHCANELDRRHRTPLSYACAKGCKASVDTLLRAGATLDTYSDNHTSPLGFAIQKNHFELTKALLQAKINANELLGTRGQVPLMMAASLEMVKFLCETYNFDINATDNVGRSVLGYFVGAGPSLLDRYVDAAEATRVVDYLIERGANIYVKSMAGMSLIDYAVCREDDFESLQLLLKRGPKLVEKEADEWTPLHWACREGNIEMAKLLLGHGQEAKKVTTVHPPKDWTPYDMLVHYGFQDEFTHEGSDKSTIYALGRPKVIMIDKKSSEEHIDYSQLAVEIGNAPKPKPERSPTCQLCVRMVSTGLSFHCKTCNYTTCLMCNHTLHNKHPGHVLETYYNFKTDHRVNAHSTWRQQFVVKIPFAFDVQRPDWQDWVQRVREEHPND